MENKWVPKIGEDYYCINSDGEINSKINDGNIDAEFHIIMKNSFETNEKARFELKKINFLGIMEQEFEPWKCNWNDEDETKYRLDYNYNNDVKRIKVMGDFSYKGQGTIYTLNRETANEYANNPDTAKYLFGIEPIEKKYIVIYKRGDDTKLMYLKEITYLRTCEYDDDKIDEIILTMDKQKAEIFTNKVFANIASKRCGSCFKVIEIKDKNE